MGALVIRRATERTAMLPRPIAIMISPSLHEVDEFYQGVQQNRKARYRYSLTTSAIKVAR